LANLSPGFWEIQSKEVMSDEVGALDALLAELEQHQK